MLGVILFWNQKLPISRGKIIWGDEKCIGS